MIPLRYKYIGASALAQQVWGKPLPGGTWAVLAINGATDHAFNVSVPLKLLNTTGSAGFTVEDLWSGAALPAGAVQGGAFAVPSVGPRDSGFYKLVPLPAAAA